MHGHTGVPAAAEEARGEGRTTDQADGRRARPAQYACETAAQVAGTVALIL